MAYRIFNWRFWLFNLPRFIQLPIENTILILATCDQKRVKNAPTVRKSTSEKMQLENFWAKLEHPIEQFVKPRYARTPLLSDYFSKMKFTSVSIHNDNLISLNFIKVTSE